MAMRASLFWLGQCGRGLDEGGVAACMTIPQGSRACGTVECPMCAGLCTRVAADGRAVGGGCTLPVGTTRTTDILCARKMCTYGMNGEFCVGIRVLFIQVFRALAVASEPRTERLTATGSDRAGSATHRGRCSAPRRRAAVALAGPRLWLGQGPQAEASRRGSAARPDRFEQRLQCLRL